MNIILYVYTMIFTNNKIRVRYLIVACLLAVYWNTDWSNINDFNYKNSVKSCWNSIYEPEKWEQCDDWNFFSGDGCSISCEKEYLLQSDIIPECSDWIDNDLDGLDDENDPGCQNASDDDEWNSLWNDIFVSPNWIDTADWSISSPFWTIQKAIDTAKPWDTIFLRSWVHNSWYDGAFWKKQIGQFITEWETNKPITVKSYDDEKAIINWGVSLDWKKCDTITCWILWNNPNIYFAKLNWKYSIDDFKIVHNEYVIPNTRDVKSTDSFYSDNVSNWNIVSTGNTYTLNSLQDKNIFIQNDSSYYIWSQIWINTCNNNLLSRDIIDYTPDTQTITFSPNISCDEKYLKPWKDKYVIVNNINTLSEWEYYFDLESNSIFYWSVSDFPSEKLLLVEKTHWFLLDSRSNIVIDWLEFHNFVTDSISSRVWNNRFADNLVIKKSKFVNAGDLRIQTYDNVLLTRNELIQNGAFLPSNVEKLEMSFNYATRWYTTWIWSYWNIDSYIHHNTVENSHSHHWNAFTAWYLWNENLVFEHNYARNSNIPLTFGWSRKLVYKHNVLESVDYSSPSTQWWNHKREWKDLPNESIIMENNTFIWTVNISDEYKDVTVRNNILYWWSFVNISEINKSNNLYLHQPRESNDIDSTDVVEEDWSKIFVDYRNFDYRILPWIELWQSPNNWYVDLMSSDKSYVWAIKPLMCDSIIPNAMIVFNLEEIYQGDKIILDWTKSTFCGDATSINDYTWRVNNQIVTSWKGESYFEFEANNNWIIKISLEVTDDLWNSDIKTIEIYVKSANVPGQILSLHLDSKTIDSSWRNYHWKWNNDIEWEYSEGISWKSIDLSSVVDTPYITVPHQDVFTWSNELSISVWAKRNNINAKEKIFDSHSWYYIWFENSTIKYYVNWDGEKSYSNVHFWEIDNPVLDNDWHYYVLTFNWSETHLYVDGVKISTSNKSTWKVETAGRPINLWYDLFWGYGKFSWFIDEFFIFDRELTTSEIYDYFLNINTTSPVIDNQLEQKEEVQQEDIEEQEEKEIIPEDNTSTNKWWSSGNTKIIIEKNNSIYQNILTDEVENNDDKLDKSIILRLMKEHISKQKATESKKIDTIENNDSWLILKKEFFLSDIENNISQSKKYSDSCWIINSIQTMEYEIKNSHESKFIDEDNFSDKKNVLKMYELGIISWNWNWYFSPKSWTTRAEFLKIVLKTHCYDYQDIETKDINFIDVDKDSWQAKVVKKAKQMNIITWDLDLDWNLIFRPNDYITRIEAIKIILNLSTLELNITTKSSYKDIDIDWHKKYVELWEELWLYSPEDEWNIFWANNKINREEMLLLLDKLIQFYK